MPSDIRLNDNAVVVEGDLDCTGRDFQLDSPQRRVGSNSEPYRRALVHGPKDSLIVNYNNDYLGVEVNAGRDEGFVLNGNAELNGKAEVKGDLSCAGSIKSGDMIESRRGFYAQHLGVGDDAELYVGGKASYKQAPTVPDILIEGLGTPVTVGGNPGGGIIDSPIGGGGITYIQPASIVDIVKDLRDTIGLLERRIATLESR